MKKKKLICSLCSYTIDNQNIIRHYHDNCMALVKHCICCSRLQYPRKRRFQKWFKKLNNYSTLIKVLSYSPFKEEKCKECSSAHVVSWNGFCPACGEKLLLT